MNQILTAAGARSLLLHNKEVQKHLEYLGEYISESASNGNTMLVWDAPNEIMRRSVAACLRAAGYSIEIDGMSLIIYWA